VLVAGSDGATRTYRVIGREEAAKTQIDLSKYFSACGTLRLTLMTCDGRFNGSNGHYCGNNVVTAAPV
jgi:hypothetical protein